MNMSIEYLISILFVVITNLASLTISSMNCNDSTLMIMYLGLFTYKIDLVILILMVQNSGQYCLSA